MILANSPVAPYPRNMDYYMLSSYRKSRHSVHCRHGINLPRPCLVSLDSLARLSDAVLEEGKASSRDKWLRYRTSTHDVLSTTSDVLCAIAAMPSNFIIRPMSNVEHEVEPWVEAGAGQGRTSHMLAVRSDQWARYCMCW
jgi:hypothetical protein